MGLLRKIKIYLRKGNYWWLNVFNRPIFYSENDQPNDSVVIIGSTRSGTTYLMENLNENNEYRIIFEPFNPEYVEDWTSFSARPYIDESSSEEEKKVLYRTLRGHIECNWVNKFNRQHSNNQRILKSVRGQLLIPFTAAEYPEIPIIYLLRSPFEVVESRINYLFDENDFQLILNQKTFIEKYYSQTPLDSIQNKIKTPAGKHAFLWCLENKFLLENEKQLQLVKVTYDQLKGQKAFWNGSKLIFTNTSVYKPSPTSNPKKKTPLSPKEMEDITMVLNGFSIEESDWKNYN